MTDTSCYCSFCCKRSNEVETLFAGPTVFICSECVELCQDILHDNRAERRRTATAGEREYLSWGVA